MYNHLVYSILFPSFAHFCFLGRSEKKIETKEKWKIKISITDSFRLYVGGCILLHNIFRIVPIRNDRTMCAIHMWCLYFPTTATLHIHLEWNVWVDFMNAFILTLSNLMANAVDKIDRVLGFNKGKKKNLTENWILRKSFFSVVLITRRASPLTLCTLRFFLNGTLRFCLHRHLIYA